jgi:hypothetical protein
VLQEQEKTEACVRNPNACIAHKSSSAATFSCYFVCSDRSMIDESVVPSDADATCFLCSLFSYSLHLPVASSPIPTY